MWSGARIRGALGALVEGNITGRLGDLLRKMYPDRQILMRAHGEIKFITLSRGLQVGATLLAVVVAGWVGYTSMSFFHYGSVLERRDRELARAGERYDMAMSDLAVYRERFDSMSLSIEESQDRILGLIGKNRALHQGLQSTKSQLEMTQTERIEISRLHDQLTEQLGALEIQLDGVVGHNQSLRSSASTLRTELDSLSAEQMEATEESIQLTRRVRELETELSILRLSQEDVIERLAENTAINIGEIEKTIAMTGLEADELVMRLDGTTEGQGGPFVAFEPGMAEELPIDKSVALLDRHIARWEQLQAVLRLLPLSAPMDGAHVTSGYGRRQDPVNNRLAMHDGIDLAGPIRSAVLTTAPGKVVYVGWKGRYGKVVEVDHGMGIRTRYAHLRKIYVESGQEIGYREKIGQMGSTGRSTGPHLHYEVIIDGESMDPTKFLRAGKYVFKG